MLIVRSCIIRIFTFQSKTLSSFYVFTSSFFFTFLQQHKTSSLSIWEIMDPENSCTCLTLTSLYSKTAWVVRFQAQIYLLQYSFFNFFTVFKNIYLYEIPQTLKHLFYSLN